MPAIIRQIIRSNNPSTLEIRRVIKSDASPATDKTITVTHTMTAPRMRFWVDIVRFCTTSISSFCYRENLSKIISPSSKGKCSTVACMSHLARTFVLDADAHRQTSTNNKPTSRAAK